MARDDCLRLIGEIAIEWRRAESEVLELLWLYLGTDRQTFRILTDPMRSSDQELLLKRLVNEKETDVCLKRDVLHALGVVQVCRENRNHILHKISEDVWERPQIVLERVEPFKEELKAFLAAMQTLRRAATLFVVRRDGLETPDGDYSGLDELAAGDEFSPIAWPAKPKKLNAEDWK